MSWVEPRPLVELAAERELDRCAPLEAAAMRAARTNVAAVSESGHDHRLMLPERMEDDGLVLRRRVVGDAEALH